MFIYLFLNISNFNIQNIDKNKNKQKQEKIIIKMNQIIKVQPREIPSNLNSREKTNNLQVKSIQFQILFFLI